MPSAETQLRHLRREHTKVTNDLANALTKCSEYRQRASKAESEVAEWKKRFDALLAMKPTVNPSSEPK
jgi:predicted  nucleic acid-binding Zn-ribbon protein